MPEILMAIASLVAAVVLLSWLHSIRRRRAELGATTTVSAEAVARTPNESPGRRFIRYLMFVADHDRDLQLLLRIGSVAFIIGLPLALLHSLDIVRMGEQLMLNNYTHPATMRGSRTRLGDMAVSLQGSP